MHSITRGLPAGAAGTLALDMVTYGDLLRRGRSSSGIPARVTERLADGAGEPPGDGGQEENRTQASGALITDATGVAARATYGLVRQRRAARPEWAGRTSYHTWCTA
jgi:hypothetical protein